MPTIHKPGLADLHKKITADNKPVDQKTLDHLVAVVADKPGTTSEQVAQKLATTPMSAEDKIEMARAGLDAGEKRDLTAMLQDPSFAGKLGRTGKSFVEAIVANRAESKKSEKIEFVELKDVAAEVAGAHPSAGATAACPYFNALKAGDAETLRDVARETIKNNVFGDASFQKSEKVLIGALQMDPADKKGETNHLLGLTYFHLERYGDAVRHLEVAAQRDPGNADIKQLLEHAKVNRDTNIQRPMGTSEKLDAKTLLQPPALHIRTPENIAPMPVVEEPGWFKKALVGGVGAVGGALTEGAIKLVNIFGRDKSKTFAFESWDKKSDLIGKLELAAIRHDLNGDKLSSTYDKGTLVGFQQPGQKKPEWTDRFRTATGAWTTQNPMEGAAGTEFQRTGSDVKVRKNRVLDESLPSPREVSRVMLAAKGERKTVPFLNNLAISWIQFQNHDWVSHRPSDGTEGFYKIPLKDDDPFKKTYGMDNMYVPATSANPIKQEGKLTYLNEVTHWWDASQIYGSDQATQDRLRTGANGAQVDDGKMRIEGEQLPINPETGVGDTGFARNWWTGLDLFHTLFVKHHNTICDKLKAAHPEWGSDQLFQTARLINAAVLAKIHTVEWTPAVLPNKKLVGGMGTNWWGLMEQMRKPFEERKVKGSWEPQHEVLGGIAGGKLDNHGKPYGLSEEFVDVYRLHAAMADHIEVLPIGAKEAIEQIDANATRGGGSRAAMEKHGMATMLNSFGHQHMHALENNNYPEFFSKMSLDKNAVTDMGAIDILRSRERGIPPYNQFRRDLGLNELQSFKDLGVDDATVKELEKLYGPGKEGLEKMDLLVGTSCELKRPHNYGFGETLFTVFIQMASRRLQADPFFTEKFNEKYYTKEGMEIIENATLKSILLEEFPDLKNSDLMQVNNAFEPWGTNADTHPQEHPLTSESESYLSNSKKNKKAGKISP